jgi:hypothetical protein
MTEDEAWDELERRQAKKVAPSKLTKEEIIKNLFNCIRNLEYRLNDAVLEEREACAKLCESEGHRIDASWESCAEAIRARGKK